MKKLWKNHYITFQRPDPNFFIFQLELSSGVWYRYTTHLVTKVFHANFCIKKKAFPSCHLFESKFAISTGTHKRINMYVYTEFIYSYNHHVDKWIERSESVHTPACLGQYLRKLANKNEHTEQCFYSIGCLYEASNVCYYMTYAQYYQPFDLHLLTNPLYLMHIYCLYDLTYVWKAIHLCL